MIRQQENNNNISFPNSNYQSYQNQQYQQPWQSSDYQQQYIPNTLEQQTNSEEVNNWNQQEIKSALRDELKKIFNKETLYQYDDIVEELCVISLGMSKKYENDYVKPCNIAQSRKIGIGLKSFQGSNIAELRQYLKSCDSNSYDKIKIEQVRQVKIYNLYFEEEKLLERYETWLKSQGHHIKIHIESATKEFYKLQEKSKRFKNQNPMLLYDQEQYYNSKTNTFAPRGKKLYYSRGGGGGRYFNDRGYQNRGNYQRGGRGGRNFIKGQRGNQYHRPRLDSNNFPGLSQSLHNEKEEEDKEQIKEDQVSQKYVLQDFFTFFNSHKFQTTSHNKILLQKLNKLPEINNIKLSIPKPHNNLALLQACANQMVNKESHRKQSMSQDDDGKEDSPDKYNFLKKATVLTGNHYKLRNRAMSQNIVEGYTKLPDSIQKIIQEQIAEENQQKGKQQQPQQSDENTFDEGGAKVAQRQRLLTMG